MTEDLTLSDFSTNGRRLAILSSLGLLLGIIAGLVTFALLRLIGLITHLAYDGRVGWSLIAPNIHHWGIGSIVVPVIGGLAVGLLAKYGTDKIRGHGIPEAIQAILEDESKMSPRVALIKPIASAITIGTGGPFGAEGPIIMTGGAIGSLISQFFRLSSLERRTLLVAGAAAGMSATFGAPIASVFLGIELLLFEWRPRSLVPVGIAAATADGMRAILLGTVPVFETPVSAPVPWHDFIWVVLIGLAAGFASGVMTKLVYFAEDTYGRLPIHWVWWPAIGGFVVGIGGLIDPRALGVGYPTIRLIDSGHFLWAAAVTLFIVKAVIWVISLSSGTSGGVLAPLLILGGSLGIVLSPLLPGHMTEVWATLGMAAMLSGALRAPFTATLFTMETTHDWNLILPVFAASVTGMVVTLLWLPHSILTEKIARRNVHVSQEYDTRQLDIQAVQDIMIPRSKTHTLLGTEPIKTMACRIADAPEASHRSYPVLDRYGEVIGVAKRSQIMTQPGEVITDIMDPAHFIGGWERVQTLAEAMARSNAGEFVVQDQNGVWVGWISRDDIFQTWRRALQEEERREIIYRIPWRRASVHKVEPSSDIRLEKIELSVSRCEQKTSVVTNEKEKK